jgi:class 3 adenylate cyclase
VRSALRVSRAALTGRILIADDDAGNREILSGQLLHEGHQVEVAENGLQALQRLRDSPFDLVLMDLIMPVMDGITALERIRSDEASHELPVLMISGVDEIGSMVWCLDLGADDYILKPIDASLLRARVLSVLERKKLRDIERRKTRELESALREVEEQRAISERLLLNILPKTVAQELRESGSVSAMYFEDVTIAMTDFVHFTRSSQRLAAEELVHALHEHFTAYDTIVERYGLEKLKTVGDSYIFLAGIPERTPSHPIDVVLAAMEMIAFGKERAARDPLVSWQMRVGIHTGPVIAGVVGIHKFAFDVWGDAMNLCSRMEAASVADRVNISTKTYDRIKDFFACEGREKVRTKDGAEVEMYFVNGILPKLLDTNNGWPPSAFSRRYRMYFRKDPIAFPPPAVFDIPVSTPT